MYTHHARSDTCYKAICLLLQYVQVVCVYYIYTYLVLWETCESIHHGNTRLSSWSVSLMYYCVCTYYVVPCQYVLYRYIYSTHLHSSSPIPLCVGWHSIAFKDSGMFGFYPISTASIYYVMSCTYYIIVVCSKWYCHVLLHGISTQWPTTREVGLGYNSKPWRGTAGATGCMQAPTRLRDHQLLHAIGCWVLNVGCYLVL